MRHKTLPPIGPFAVSGPVWRNLDVLEPLFGGERNPQATSLARSKRLPGIHQSLPKLQKCRAPMWEGRSRRKALSISSINPSPLWDGSSASGFGPPRGPSSRPIEMLSATRNNKRCRCFCGLQSCFLYSTPWPSQLSIVLDRQTDRTRPSREDGSWEIINTPSRPWFFILVDERTYLSFMVFCT